MPHTTARRRRTRGVTATLAVLLAAGAGLATAAPGASASTPQPVDTTARADPGVLLDSGHFYSFTTSGNPASGKLPELLEASSATAGGPWSAPANVFSSTSSWPAWIDKTQGIWAPDMIKTQGNGYVVYFAAHLNVAAGTAGGIDTKPAGNSRCIGTAQSSKPDGNFTISASPLVCFDGYGAGDDMSDAGHRVPGQGVIDAAPVVVTISGSQELFLVYKTQGLPATIRMVRLSYADGVSVLGTSHELVYGTASASPADTIEAPSLIQNGSWFILFVAHGNWDSCGYSTQWYKSQHIWSWTHTGASDLLTMGNTGLCGPGGADVTASEVSGQDRIFLHGWVKPGTATPSAPSTQEQESGQTRVMYAAVLTIGSDGYTPVVGSYLTP